MLIFQISPQRMGSTWQFNTARELLLLQSTSLKSLYLESEKDCPEFEYKKEENILIKSHNLDASWLLKFTENFEVRVLLSLRNLFDTIRSSRRVGIGGSDIDVLSGISDSLRCLKDLSIGGVSCHLSLIDRLNSENELLQETIRIRDFLGISAANDQTVGISSGLSKDSIRNLISNKLELEKTFSVYDQTTLWHGNHIEPKNQGDIEELLGFELVSQDSEIRPLDEVIKLENQVINLKNFLSPYTQQRDELTQQRDELTQQRDELTQQRDELTQQRDELTQQRDEIVDSTIWKLTNPLRKAIDLFKK